jgi:hypothetical protein
MLTALQERYELEVLANFSGACATRFDYDHYGMDIDDVYNILIENEVEQCTVCSWWQYPGDYCMEHEHEEITCNSCCEEG